MVPQGDKSSWMSRLARILIGMAIGIIFLLLKKPVLATVVLATSAVLLVLMFSAPVFYRHIEKGLQKFSAWVGTALTYMLLVPFFFVCFLPAHVFLFLTKKDPLRLRFPAPAASCWIMHPRGTGKEKYKRQF
jgi:hypothetical protein